MFAGSNLEMMRLLWRRIGVGMVASASLAAAGV
jgi:hypothetical protein